ARVVGGGGVGAWIGGVVRGGPDVGSARRHASGLLERFRRSDVDVDGVRRWRRAGRGDERRAEKQRSGETLYFHRPSTQYQPWLTCLQWPGTHTTCGRGGSAPQPGTQTYAVPVQPWKPPIHT